jgi:pimeloyl-ACP methyl ester carboxylesterase
MLHGAEDPHPGRGTLELLRRHVPGIEYREFQRCGHYPWLERQVRREFLSSLIEWMDQNA